MDVMDFNRVEAVEHILEFSTFLIILIPIAIGNFHLAKRLKGEPYVYAIATLVPVVNIVFFVYLFFKILFIFLDREVPELRASDD